jgi:hypothetical protein
MIKPADRRWVRKNGTNWVGQLTPAFVERLNDDMTEISYEKAMKLRAHVNNNNKTRSQRQMVKQVDQAQAVKKILDPTVSLADDDVAPVEQVMMPETPEAAIARLNAESGDDIEVPITDGLDDMKRDEFFDLIDAEDLDVKKYGSNDKIVELIREARESKPEPSTEEEPVVEMLDDGEPVDEDAPPMDGGAPVEEE